jgi:hypothetical protein
MGRRIGEPHFKRTVSSGVFRGFRKRFGWFIENPEDTFLLIEECAESKTPTFIRAISKKLTKTINSNKTQSGQ